MLDEISNPIYIKTTHYDTELRKRLDWFLSQPGCSWSFTQNGKDSQPQLTISRQGVVLADGTEQLSFHPSMALIRLINILRGESDRYLEATQLKAGNSLIDATLGLGTDALIGAWAVGAKGRVFGIEKSPILAAIVQDGLDHFLGMMPNCKNAEKRTVWHTLAQVSQQIKVIWADNRNYFIDLPDHSVDVVYFDPMFRQTYEHSHSIQPLHRWSDHSPLDLKTVIEACRIARHRVVLKDRKNSPEFQRLGFEILPGGQYSPIDYGVILV
jgi:Protein of unknown function (DUF548).